MTKIDDIFKFKKVEDICGCKIVFYRLIGTNITFSHDVNAETITVIDDELVGGEEEYVVYPEARFFEEYGGFHLGTDDASIEDLIRFEYKFLIDSERSDFAATKAVMRTMNKPVKFADIAHQNFN
jgi:hypothetical protein